jgi:hypothetical protein
MMQVGPSPRRQRAAIALLFVSSCALSALVAGVLWWKGAIAPSSLEPLRTAIEARLAGARSKRILVIGDSFLAHWRLPHHLKHDLAAWANQHGVGLLNTAEHGGGPMNYLAQLKSVRGVLKPQLVLLFYFVGNDLMDVLLRVPATREDDPCRPATLDLADEEGFDWEAMHAHGIDPDLIARAQGVVRSGGDEGEPFNPWLLLTAMRTPNYVVDNLLIESECSRNAWGGTKALLVESIALTRSTGAEIRIVAIPAVAQMDRERLKLYRRATFVVDDRVVGSRRPQELLTNLSEQYSVPLLDLLPHLSAHPDPASLYWRLDPHFSESGHRFVFDILREEILDPWLDE